jgi:NADH-quinone oxidoreductase subunit E
MLTKDEIQEIEAEIPNYEQKRAVCVEALKIVQRHQGWVSDESLRDIAEFLEMSPDELDSVATFYSMIFREPVGRHVILLCNSVSCWIMGYENLYEQLSAHLGIQMGETSEDGRFTLLPISCMGTCDHAPAMMIDDDLYRDLDPEKLEEILDRYA